MPAPRSLRLCATLAAALLLAFVSGCSTPSVSAGTNPRIPESGSVALLRAGDSLVVAIQGVPDASNNAVQINDQGMMSLPLIGAVSAAGLTSSDLSQRIRELYISRQIYTVVDISVAVTERYVYVGGEVQRPGRIIWTPDLTVSKAIQAAGGFTLYAREAAVNLVREQNAYQFDASLAQRNPAEDARLLPGDSLQVPRSAF
jgi:protein involved in polysaccharide export with SLBB domain